MLRDFQYRESYRLSSFRLPGLIIVWSMLLLSGCTCRHERPVTRPAPDARDVGRSRAAAAPTSDLTRKSTAPRSGKAGDRGYLENRSASPTGSVDGDQGDPSNPVADVTARTGGASSHRLGRKRDPKVRTDDDGDADQASSSAAHDRATLLLKEARRHADRGDYATAFQNGSAAWQVLRGHPDNPSCRELGVRAQKAMQDYGDELNRNASQNGVVIELTKPLQIE